MEADEGGNGACSTISIHRLLVEMADGAPHQTKGTAKPSMALSLLESIARMEGEDTAEEEEVARNATAVAYAGTSTNLLQSSVRISDVYTSWCRYG